MNLNGLSYSEIAETRKAIEERRHKIIESFCQNIGFTDPEEIKEVFKRGYQEMNPLIDVGRCNLVLKKIEDLENECQEARGN